MSYVLFIVVLYVGLPVGLSDTFWNLILQWRLLSFLVKIGLVVSKETMFVKDNDEDRRWILDVKWFKSSMSSKNTKEGVSMIACETSIYQPESR